MTTAFTMQQFFLQKGGESGRIIRSTSWAATPIGSPDTWPSTLRQAVRFMLDSSFPMYIAWGPSFTMLYNDAYIPSLGPARHPRMMGSSIKDVSPEVWQSIESLYEKVWQGEQVMRHDYPILINKSGRTEQYFFDLTYTPLYLEDGTIGGLQAVFIETTDKLKAIQKLAEANNQLSFAIDAAELGTWDYNPQSNKFSGNARLKAWFGLEADDEIPLSLALAVIADEDRQRVTQAIQQAIQPASGGRYDIEYTIIHPVTDKPRYVRAKGRAWFDNNGVAFRFNGTLQDVSEQMVAKRRNEQSENYFRRLADAVPSIIWVTEPDGSCSYLNKSWYDYTGQTETESRGLGWLNATHPDDKQRAGEIFLAANAARKDFSLEYRLKSFSGDYRWAIDHGRPKFSDTGVYEGMIGTVVDIHEQKMAQEALGQMTAHLQLATDSSQVGTWSLDVKLGTLEWSALHKQMWGYEPQQAGLLYEDWWNVILEEDRPAALEKVERAKNEHLPYENTYRIQRANDGGIRWIKSFGRFFYDEYGDAVLVTGISMDITAQRNAEAAILESEERFRNLVQEAAIATAVFEGKELKLTLANEKMLQLWQKGEDVIGQRLLDFMPEMADQPFPDLLRSVYLTGVTYSDTDAPIMLNRNGRLELIYTDFSYKALRNGDGDVYGVLVAAVDVTERYKFVKQLEESENRFRSLADTAPLAVFIADDKTGITYANQELLRFVGVDNLANYEGNLWETYAHPDDLPKAIAVFKEAWKNEQPYTVEMRMKATSNKYQWFLFKAVPRYEDGLLRSFIGTGINIQPQKEITQLLEDEVAQQTAELVEVNDELAERNTDLSKAQNFLTTVLDSLVEIVSAYDNDLVYTFVNEKAERMIGRSREDIVGESAFDLHPGLQQQEIFTQILRALKGEVVHIPQRYATSDAKTVLETYIVPLFDKNKVDGIVMLSRDITPMVKLTNELQRSNSDLQQFAHVASHDLKEPVRKIRTFGSKLQYEFADNLPERAQLYLSKMESAADRMYSMIEGVLLYSSLGALEEAAEPVDLNQVINNIETDLELVIQQKGATIKPQNLPVVQGSPVLLYQLYYNLINNALKFTRSGVPPFIHVAVEPLTSNGKVVFDKVRVVVEDNGIGFSPEKNEEIFGTFSRLHSKDQFEGTGLGLALCKKIVERHGGSIYAEGKEGQGAKFIIELPAYHSILD